ncbi:MAG: serine/threonine protein kinase [Prevotella sp.]|jgi:serine/threonine protein kinase|nr:serine/threonine protein kinase [Prevotella sp.]
MESRELQPGTTLCGGKYTIERMIGSGGFGITYKAVQNGLNRTVCIKEFFLDGKCVRDTKEKTVRLQSVNQEVFEKYRQAFVKEAKMLVNLRHPNIVEVLDVFDENNTSCMVMPFIEGQTLQRLVERNGMLDYEQAVNYLGQIANAVGYIHTQNILHRDIKPDNIIITPDYHAILIDFGSAREFVQDKTQAHTSILTKCYAPPEQYNAVSRKGSYTDIYSLGAVYYFAMTGKTPLEAATRHIETMPEPGALNTDVTDDANRTILKAMAMKPENRHQTVDEFLDDLFGHKPSGPIEENIENKKKNKLATSLIIALVSIIIAGIFSWRYIEYRKTETEFDNVRKKAIEYYNNPRGITTALEFCNEALEIKPDDAEMRDLKIKIAGKIKERDERRFAEVRDKAVDYFNFAKNTDAEYFATALNLCDSALSIKPNDEEMKRLKIEAERLVHK